MLMDGFGRNSLRAILGPVMSPLQNVRIVGMTTLVRYEVERRSPRSSITATVSSKSHQQ